MSLQQILENWSEYDVRKITERSDNRYFLCSAGWEIDCLIQKIQQVYPDLLRDEIKNAVEYCCENLKPPHVRDPFVKSVLARLGI